MPEFTQLCQKALIKLQDNTLSIYPEKSGRYLKQYALNDHDKMEVRVMYYNHPESGLLFTKHLNSVLNNRFLEKLPLTGRMPSDDPDKESYHLSFDTMIDEATITGILSLFEEHNLISAKEKNQILGTYQSLDDAIRSTAEPVIPIPHVRYVPGKLRFFPASSTNTENADSTPNCSLSPGA